MLTLENLKLLLCERIVYDIGQFTPEAKKWLRKEVKAGRVQSMMIYQRFPLPKRGYWIVGDSPPAPHGYDDEGRN